MYTIEDIKEKVIEICDINDYNNDEIVSDCFTKIDKYLSYDNSSLEILFNCLEEGIKNGSWILAWHLISKETNKLSGKYYQDIKETENEKKKILLDYQPINLGDRVFEKRELQDLQINLGLIDAFGVFHTSYRGYEKIDHRELAEYLKLKDRIFQYYIRVGSVAGRNNGMLSAESLLYGDRSSLKHFLLTEQMAIALYNAIMSKVGIGIHTFEEKLAYFGNEFGYYSNQYNVVPQIYDNELFNNNMKVLSSTLGKKFNKNFFLDILKK